MNLLFLKIILQLVFNITLLLLNVLIMWFTIGKLRYYKIVRKKFLYISINIIFFIIFWINIYFIFNVNFIN